MNQAEARDVESRFPVAGYLDESPHDEVDLYELLQSIWQGWLKITLIALLFVVVGAAYAYTTTPWFEANLKIGATKSEKLFGINNSELIKVSSTQSMQNVRKKLVSAENFKDFYLNSSVAQELLIPPENITKEQYAYAVFNGQLKEVVVEAKRGEEKLVDAFVELNFSYPDSVDGASLFYAYLLWSDGRVKEELVKSFNSKRNNELAINETKMQKMLNDYNRDNEAKVIRSVEDYKYKRIILRDELKALKVQLIKKNQQKVLVLDENIAIAKRLGYQKPTSPTDVKEFKNLRPVGDAAVEINNGGYSWLDKLPLYYRGFESLQAEKIELDKRQQEKYPSAAIVDMEKQLALLDNDREIEKLQNRAKPAAFIDAYIVLEKRNAHLNSLQIDVGGSELYELIAKPVAGSKVIKPKKLLILALAGFLGLILGVLTVLIQGAAKKRKASL